MMFIKRILGIIIVIIGIALIGTSFYIKNQVIAGREQISDAEKKVSIGKEIFSLNPVTKEVGKDITDSAEKQIKAGSAKADRYATLALWLQIGGGALIFIGFFLIFKSRKKN